MKLPTKPEIDKYMTSTVMYATDDYETVTYRYYANKMSFSTADCQTEFREATYELQKELDKVGATLASAILYRDNDFSTTVQIQLCIQYPRKAPGGKK